MLWKAPLLPNTSLIKGRFKIFRYKDSIAVKVYSFREDPL